MSFFFFFFFLLFMGMLKNIIMMPTSSRGRSSVECPMLFCPTNSERLININNHQTLLLYHARLCCALLFFLHIHQLIDALFKVQHLLSVYIPIDVQ